MSKFKIHTTSAKILSNTGSSLLLGLIISITGLATPSTTSPICTNFFPNPSIWNSI